MRDFSFSKEDVHWMLGLREDWEVAVDGAKEAKYLEQMAFQMVT